MKTIQIHKIIKKIETDFPIQWEKYKNLLSSKNYFLVDDECLYNQRWILDNSFNEIWLINIEYDHPWWNWNGKERKDIKFILNEFTKWILKDTKFCPYCGKTPLIAYGENKDKRAYDLDHIYPWTHYPYLTFNLHNLVPTCKICNTIKKDKDLALHWDYFHPYFWYIKSDKFSIDSEIDFDSEYNFWDYNRTLVSEHARLFTLYDIYENSQDTHNEILFIQKQESRIWTYGSKLDTIGINDKRWFFFQNYYPENSEDILKYANGKLKRDMINSLKI